MPIAASADIRKSGYANPVRRAGRLITGADVRRAATLFKVLAHPDRLRLACRIGDGRPTTQKELIEEFGWSQPTTARHLAMLRDVGLVRAERDGAEVRLSAGDEIGLQLMAAVCDWLHGPSTDADGEQPLAVPPPLATGAD